MVGRLILAGDVNLKGVTDSAVPFRHVAGTLNAAEVVFANLECCLHLPLQLSDFNEGFFTDPQIAGAALRMSGIHAVGLANNVNYGAANITASIARLDELGVLHTGAGSNLAAARAPAVVIRNDLRIGIVQRSSVYWPSDHEAHPDTPGIAVIRAHTAYQVPTGRGAAGVMPANRPGIPPLILTWADAAYIDEFRMDIEALRTHVDIVVVSCHWGLGREPLQYMTQIAHAAIDAGADVVMGHGPHYPLPVEFYKDRPIFYGLGNLTFSTGHHGREFSGWIGMLVELNRARATTCYFRLVRSNESNETFLCDLADELDAIADLAQQSRRLGARFHNEGDRVRITPV